MTIEETKKVLDDAVDTLNRLRPQPPDQMYIGDGVYAEYEADRDMIRLYTERPEGRHEIWLEREVYDVLAMFASRCGWAVYE